MLLLEDETLRDGLQAEPKVLSLGSKVSLFKDLVSAGLKRIQVGSFVHPKAVPQMADTDELIREIKGTPGVLLTGLVLNGKGLERALAAGLKHVSMSVSVSEAHSLRNVRRSAGEALASMVEQIGRAAAAGLAVRAGAQCAFGCVYQGNVPEEGVLRAVEAMAAAGAVEVNLADTTGMANPLQVERLVKKVKGKLPETALSLHMHDTRGLGLANMYAGYRAGVRIFDVAAGGLGGCPFVRGAAGNVPTEDAANMFGQMGLDTGVDLPALCRVTASLERLLDRPLPGRMGRVLASASCENIG